MKKQTVYQVRWSTNGYSDGVELYSKQEEAIKAAKLYIKECGAWKASISKMQLDTKIHRYWYMGETTLYATSIKEGD